MSNIEIVDKDYSEEMKNSYRDYAMSVIASRALPDVRDGLKPVQRRVLFAMMELGVLPNKPHRKCARIVGDTMGKYHPHGDSSIYEALARMGQPWITNIPLVDGHGNFGSIDGDSPAAMRYCVTGDTLISTDKGMKYIKDISDTDLNSEKDINITIKSYIGNNKAIKLFNSGIHNTKTIELQNGLSITGTNNHPLMILDDDLNFKWKLIGDILPNDKICISIDDSNTVYGNNDNLSEAKMLGCMISEGYITTQNRIGINNKNLELIYPVKLFFEQKTNTKANITEHKKYYEYIIANKNYYNQFISTYNFTDKSNTKEIPSCVFNGTKEYQKLFISYLFEGDGSCDSNCGIQYSTRSIKLAKQLQILLIQNFGIFSYITISTKQNCNTEYKLCITSFGLIKFYNNINFVSERKKIALENAINLFESLSTIANNSYYNNSLINKYLRERYTTKHISHYNFGNLKTVSKCEKYISNIDYKKIRNILNNYMCIDVLSVKDSGKQIVYSLKVDSECHSFIGNGFINHNTEARLSDCGALMVENINKGLVDFIPNFDNSEKEPVLLPSMIPNLLINGTTGIAVGMATDIPTHNPTEVINGIIAYIDNNDITIPELMKYIPSPDFPTGGIIVNKNDLENIYRTGSGKIRIRCKSEIEDSDNGRKNIVITEIPYTSSGKKSSLVESIVNLMKDKTFDEIYDVRDESSKEGIRIIIEVKKDRDINNLLNGLYKKTQLENTYSVNMLAVKDNQPIIFNLKSLIGEFVDFQKILYTKEYKHMLQKANDRLEIVNGLIKATDLIDVIIEILRGCKSVKQAKDCLMLGLTDDINFKSNKTKEIAKSMKFTDRQSDAILAMPLSKLINLELEKLHIENDTLTNSINEYKVVLSSEIELMKIIKKRLNSYKKMLDCPRKTQIENLTIESYVENRKEEDVCVLIDRFGYTKTIDVAGYNRMNEDNKKDYKHIITLKNTDRLCLFTENANMYQVKVSDIPKCKSKDKGVLLNTLCKVAKENILLYTSFEKLNNSNVFFGTKNGYFKLTKGTEFDTNRQYISSTKIESDDLLLNVSLVDDINYSNVTILTDDKFILRLNMSDVSEKKKTGRGVTAIKLNGTNKVNKYLINDSTYDSIKIGRRGSKGKLLK